MPDQATTCIASRLHLLIGGMLLVPVISPFYLLFARRWDRSPVEDFLLQPGGLAGGLAVVVASAIIHELLHAFGWCAFGRVPWSSVSYVPTWRGLGLAAILKAPVSMAVYRVGVLIPAVVLGIGPLVYALLTGSGLVLVWGSFFLFECLTDSALLVGTRAVPASARVVTHPTELGCVVVTEDPEKGWVYR